MVVNLAGSRGIAKKNPKLFSFPQTMPIFIFISTHSSSHPILSYLILSACLHLSLTISQLISAAIIATCVHKAPKDNDRDIIGHGRWLNWHKGTPTNKLMLLLLQARWPNVCCLSLQLVVVLKGSRELQLPTYTSLAFLFRRSLRCIQWERGRPALLESKVS